MFVTRLHARVNTGYIAIKPTSKYNVSMAVMFLQYIPQNM
jgi:hypothetical protein